MSFLEEKEVDKNMWESKKGAIFEYFIWS